MLSLFLVILAQTFWWKAPAEYDPNMHPMASAEWLLGTRRFTFLALLSLRVGSFKHQEKPNGSQPWPLTKL